MNKFIALLALSLFLSSSAFSACQTLGSGSFKQIYCDDGNNYTVQKFGNQTILNGSNSRSGTRWNQNNYNYGNGMSTQNGTRADGSRYNCTTINGVTTCY